MVTARPVSQWRSRPRTARSLRQAGEPWLTRKPYPSRGFKQRRVSTRQVQRSFRAEVYGQAAPARP